MVPSDYVHRIGRTGRAGTQGDAISLVCIDEMPLLRDIERLLGAPIPSQTVAGFEPDPSARPEPIRLRTGGGNGGQRGRGPAHGQRRSFSGQQPRRQRPPRAKGGASIGNRAAGNGNWTSLPGERKRR